MPDELHLDRLFDDTQLDSAIQAYAFQEPHLGLEARVLRRVQQPARRRWLWLAVPAFATLAALLITSTGPTIPDEPQTMIRAAVPPAPTAESSPVSPTPGTRQIRHVRTPLVAPPEPPTPQQRALLSLALHYPGAEAMLTHTPPTELRVETLTIEPLAVDPLSIPALMPLTGEQ